jgi:hypothetical protein
LELDHLESPLGIELLPDVPKDIEFKKWIGSEMYFENGLEVKRKGRFEVQWMDTNRWDRMIWSAGTVERTCIVPVRESVEAFAEESVEASDRVQTYAKLLEDTEQWSDDYSVMDAGENQSPRTEHSTRSRSPTVSPGEAEPNSSQAPSPSSPLLKPKSSARLQRRSQRAQEETS